MREIKFRGKCAHCDEWAYGNLADYGEGEIPEIQGFVRTEKRRKNGVMFPSTVIQLVSTLA